MFAVAATVLTIGATSVSAAYKFETLTPPPSMPEGDTLGVCQINNNGQILVQAGHSGFGDLGYVYDIKTKSYTALPTDPNATPGQTLWAGFNDCGDFVGMEMSTTGSVPAWAWDGGNGWSPYESFVYSSRTKTFTNFVVPLDSAFVSLANDINDLGQIAGVFQNGGGEQGFVLNGICNFNRPHAYTILDVLPQGPIDEVNIGNFTGGTTQAVAINNWGNVVGFFTDPANVATVGTQGFMYDPWTRTFTKINVPGNVANAAYGINNKGEIVGSTYNPSGTTYGDGFIYRCGEFTTIDYPGAVYTSVAGISDSGQIVGEYVASDGVTYGAFLATPVPETCTKK